MTILKQEQFLRIGLDEAWSFFSTPRNLNRITPNDMTFEIVSDVPDMMYEGMLINYRLRPMFNIPLRWCTEITHIREKEFFIDEQRIGPYRMWHHEHHFKAVDGGILMTDLLQYDIGKSVIGVIAGKLFVDLRVKEIFSFRYETLETYFNS